MLTASLRRFTPLLAVLLCLLSASAFAMQTGDDKLASKLMGRFSEPSIGVIVGAATYLFWSLATISLIWTMATILLRRADFGELFLELIRFILFTGLFYWLLENVSGDKGFIYSIFDSFKRMGDVGNDIPYGGLGDAADSLTGLGRNIFYRVIEQMQNAEASDTMILAIMSLIILIALTLVAAQMVLVVIMAWMLAYGGIFLLGFGGARWTSLIAINYYKHAVAVGIALLALLMLMTFGYDFLSRFAVPLGDGREVEFVGLADMLVVALIMAVLGIKLPSLLYTLVTGSPLGLLAGTASMAGTAIVTGGSAIATATASMAQHTSSRRENHYATAVDAFKNMSPDMQRGDTYQTIGMRDYGLGAANGQPRARAEESVFGGPPPVSVWNDGAVGQHGVQSHQAPAQAAAQNAQESEADAGHATVATGSRQETLRDAAHTSVQNEGMDESVRRGLAGITSDQTEFQPPSDMHLLGQATSAAASSSEQVSSGGFKPAALQHSPASVTEGNQLGQAASMASSEAAQTSAVGTQPPGLQQPAGDLQQVSQPVSASSSVAQTPAGGFQPAALSPAATTQREGTHAPIQPGSLPHAAQTPTGGFHSGAPSPTTAQRESAHPSTQPGTSLPHAAQASNGGSQSVAPSSVTTRRESARASVQSGTSLPPASASTTQNAKKTRHIKRKTEVRIVDKRKASTDPGMVGSGHHADSRPAAKDGNDEVAAFRDRRSPPTDSDVEGDA
jgi:type IV secretion system protein TrbL